MHISSSIETMQSSSDTSKPAPMSFQPLALTVNAIHNLHHYQPRPLRYIGFGRPSCRDPDQDPSSDGIRIKIPANDSLGALSSIAFDPADSMRSACVAPYKVSKAMLNRGRAADGYEGGMPCLVTRETTRYSVSETRCVPCPSALCAQRYGAFHQTSIYNQKIQ